MLISLPPHLEKLVQEKVQSGRYASEGEVMREALELLDERDASEQTKLAWLRDAYQKGLESGEPIDGDQVFAELEEIIQGAEK